MFEGDFTVHRSSRRKRVGFCFNDSGVLEVHAPAGLSETLLRKIIAENLPLIEKLRQDLSRRMPPLRRYYREGELFSLWGSTIKPDITIGAGSVVVKDILEGSLAYGNPCRVVKS